jgi:nucleotide-binding universal stress UspA family protein
MADSKRIFVTTDFSPCADYAVRYAVELAKRLHADIVLGHVVDTSYLTYAALYGQEIVVDPNVASVEDAAKKHLADAAERVKALGVSTTAEFARGTPVAELVRMIASSGAFLVVTGTHGHTGFNRFLFGSTCEKLLRQSPAPVLAVKQPDAGARFKPDEFAIDRIACTTDLSDLSRSVLPFAAELSATLDAELIVVHVIDARFDSLPYAAVEAPTRNHLKSRAEAVLKEWTQWLKAPQIESRVLHGIPDKVLAEFVRDHNIDLLIMATHGHGGLAHALLGSTTERVVRTAPCPVLAVRPK